MLLCSFCNKQCKNDNSLKQHSIRCKNNPAKIEIAPKSEKWYNTMNNRKGKGANQYTKARENGEEYITSEEVKQKLRQANIGKKHSQETKEKISRGIRAAILNNPESYTSNNVCGRVKIQEYNGEKFHGSWEIEFAKWLDYNKIKWVRKVNPFNYYWNSSWHMYFPDFYLPELDLYVEVKGYETDRDREKWKVVPNLLLIKNKEIQEIKQNTYKLPR